jgi:hypothetical protein
MVCRMCEEYISALYVKEHSILCSEQISFKERLMSLKAEVKELQEEVKNEQMESIS